MSTDPAAVRIARCQCGALEARCSGEPWRVSLCHCFACKARTGSDFSVNATYREAQVALSGAAREYERRSEEGERWVRQAFCLVCGTTVWYRIEARPGSSSIAAGWFRTRDFPPPTVEVYGECAMAGLNLHIEPEAEQA